MEWRALERALRASGSERQQSVADALLFRARRRSLFPHAAQNENALELNEGLAEYCGVRLSSENLGELVIRADGILRQARSTETFARSFAYSSGPAYGALLDIADTSWRSRLTSSSDLGNLLQKAYNIPDMRRPTEADAMSSLSRYEGEEIIALEGRHEKLRQVQMAAATKKFL